MEGQTDPSAPNTFVDVPEDFENLRQRPQIEPDIQEPQQFVNQGDTQEPQRFVNKGDTQLSQPPDNDVTTHDVTNENGHFNEEYHDDDINRFTRGVDVIHNAFIYFWVQHEIWIIRIWWMLLLLAYLVYFGKSLAYKFGDEGSIRLLVCTIIGLLFLALKFSWNYISKGLKSMQHDLAQLRVKTFKKTIPWTMYVVNLLMMVTLLIVLVALESPMNLTSLAGLAAFIIISWLTSINPARVNWHPIFWGFSLQFYFAAIILKTPWGYSTFKWFGDRVTVFLSFANEGSNFVFGPRPIHDHFFAFTLMPVIVFFSAIISMLYYLGVMQTVVGFLGRFLAFTLGTTPAESINTAGNVFVGMTEAPLMIRPFLPHMTKSELHAVMTGGFATVAGTVLGAFIGFGVPANHLLSASVMSAPAALAISKLTYPETEVPHTSSEAYKRMERGKGRNLIEAASAGATDATILVANILVNVIAFLSILKLVNATLTWLGERAGFPDLTFQLICSYVLYPVALCMGTELGPDCRRIGELVGVKTFTNEFIAFKELHKLIVNRKKYDEYSDIFDVTEPNFVVYDDLDVNLVKWNLTLNKGFLSLRSEVIATYALCGFSNFGSMGIMLGIMSAIAPDRRQDIASIVLRAMIAGNTACFFTACIAGLFYQEF